MPQFTYPQPQPNPFAASISDLMLRSGDIQAQKEIALAKIRANEVTGIAGDAAQAVTQIAQPFTPQGQTEKARAESAQLTLAQQKKDIEEKATMDRIMRGAYGLAPSQQADFSGPTQPGDPTAGSPALGPDGVPPGWEKNADGVITPNRDYIAQSMARAGMGSKIPDMLEKMAKADTAVATLNETRGKIAIQTRDALGAFGATAETAIQSGMDPALAFHNAALGSVLNHTITADQVKPYLDQVDANPASALPIAQGLQKASKAQSEANAATLTASARAQTAVTGAQRLAVETPKIEADTAHAQAVAAGMPDELALKRAQLAEITAKLTGTIPLSAKDQGELDLKKAQIAEINGKLAGTIPLSAKDQADLDLRKDALKIQRDRLDADVKEINAKLTGGIPLSPKDRAELQIQRDRLSAEVKHWASQDAANEAAPALSPDALKLTAHQFAMTGQLPPMGLGKQGAAVRTKIINEAAAQYKDLDLPSQVAAFKANQNSLTQVTQTLNNVSAFENTAGKNLDQFLALASKIPDTGVPWLNIPVRQVSGQMLGSTDVAAFNAARDVALREIARVTSDPKLSGVLSDSARKEVQALSPQSATFAQIKAVAKVLKQDMANVHSSLADQAQGIQRLIATPPTSGATPSTVVPSAPAGGRQRVVGPNGESGTVPAGTPLPPGWKAQ